MARPILRPAFYPLQVVYLIIREWNGQVSPFVFEPRILFVLGGRCTLRTVFNLALGRDSILAESPGVKKTAPA
jgi:hypothetical protein